ncbi:MAG: hypothetical protein MUC88_00200 [Planctomycetes bacterium]|jgi:hypothetical protein|nr:hypothetical protein [Planctomycetota bacterium]
MRTQLVVESWDRSETFGVIREERTKRLLGSFSLGANGEAHVARMDGEEWRADSLASALDLAFGERP